MFFHSPIPKRAELSRAELIREVDKLGGLPEPIKKDTELMAFSNPYFEPISEQSTSMHGRERPGLEPIIVFSR